MSYVRQPAILRQIRALGGKLGLACAFEWMCALCLCYQALVLANQLAVRVRARAGRWRYTSKDVCFWEK